MLWLLPPDPGNTRVRLEAGLHIVPRWYDAYEWQVLAEVLRRVLDPPVEHSVVLSPEAATVAWPKSDCLLVAIEKPLSDPQRSAVARQAREQCHHVLVAAREEDGELATAWLERWIKPVVIRLLERGPWRTGHPLASYGLGSFDIDSIAAITEDPVEFLWLLDRTIRHRLKYATLGLEQNDYERSLRHMAGTRCAKLVDSYGPNTKELDQALHVLIGGTVTHEGESAVVRAGLGHWKDRRFDPRPIARVPLLELESAETLVSEFERRYPWISASDVLRLRRAASRSANEPSSTVGLLDYSSITPPSRSTHALTQALDHGLLELRAPPPLLHEAIEAIRHWEQSSWDPNTIEPLRELRRRLRPITTTPLEPHRRFAKILMELLSVLTTTAHPDLAEAMSAKERLRSLLTQPLKGWELDLWLIMIIECADRYRKLAIDGNDLEIAMSLYRETTILNIRHVYDQAQGLSAAGIADILALRGKPDQSLQILREQALPAFERIGDIHNKAVTMGRIADILQDKGELDNALNIRQNDEIPIYEHLGDARNKAVAAGRIADILQERGELDDALSIRQNDELPVYERLGDIRNKAITMGKIADILQTRGDLDRALHIRQNDQLPIFEQIGDIRAKAVTMGRIADILHARGDLDSALHIRQKDEFPVFDSIGDIRAKAITIGKIADIFQDRGDLDRALRIRQNDELPVYESIGDIRARAVTMGRIADIFQARGNLDEALRIRRHEELPVYEHIGDVHAKAACMTNIALAHLQQNAEQGREKATRLLSWAYRTFSRTNLPEAHTIESIADRYHLSLDTTEQLD